MNQSLAPLFLPSTMALVGASKDELKGGGMYLKAIISFGFKGKLYPVNRRESEVMGLKAYPSVLDIPDEVDLALLAIPAQATLQVMEECAQKRVKFVIIHSAGFKEVGDIGEELDSRVVEIARKGGVRIVGPNCMGVYCPEGGINTVSVVEPLPKEPGGMGLISHSGTLAEAITISGAERGVRYSKVVSSGNETDLNTMDYFQYLALDPKTKFIGLYLEGMSWGRRFLEVAREVTKEKPVVVWKAGRTPAGARATLSHTASLAVSDRVSEAGFKQAGIIRVQHAEEMCDLAVAFSSPYLPQGNRVAIIADSGGGCVSGGDACEMEGLQVPAFSQEIQQELKEFLTGVIPPFSGVTNPVDLVWPAYSDYLRVFPGSVEIVSRTVDAFLIFTYYPLADEKFMAEMAQVRDKTRKPVFIVPALSSTERKGMSNYTLRGMPSYPTIQRAAKALSLLVQYSQYLKEVQALVSAGEA